MIVVVDEDSMDAYKEQLGEDSHNFCFTKKSRWKEVAGWAILVGALVADGFITAGTFGTGTIFAVAMTEAILTYWVYDVEIEWPG